MWPKLGFRTKSWSMRCRRTALRATWRPPRFRSQESSLPPASGVWVEEILRWARTAQSIEGKAGDKQLLRPFYFYFYPVAEGEVSFQRQRVVRSHHLEDPRPGRRLRIPLQVSKIE